mgnify:CR=1 FL=1
MDYSKKSFEQYSGIGQYDKWLKTHHFFRTMRFYYNLAQEPRNPMKEVDKYIMYMEGYSDAAKLTDLISFNTWKLINRMLFRLRKEVIK